MSNPWADQSFEIMERPEAFRFHFPSSVMVIEPSGCGKTVFTNKLLLDNLNSFKRTTRQFHYCYETWQDGFELIKEHDVKFHGGILESELLPEWFPEGRLLVLDDLMEEGGNDKRVLDLLTKNSHHQKITVIFLLGHVSIR